MHLWNLNGRIGYCGVKKGTVTHTISSFTTTCYRCVDPIHQPLGPVWQHRPVRFLLLNGNKHWANKNLWRKTNIWLTKSLVLVWSSSLYCYIYLSYLNPEEYQEKWWWYILHCYFIVVGSWPWLLYLLPDEPPGRFIDLAGLCHNKSTHIMSLWRYLLLHTFLALAELMWVILGKNRVARVYE